MFDAAGVATGAEVAEQSASESEASAQAEHDSADPATPAAIANETREVFFVDASVTDAQTLIDGLPEGAEVVLLNGTEDGFSQMADYLSGQQGIDAIHIISHGSDGNLHAGSTALNAGNMKAYSTVLRSIGQSLTAEGDILLYGCDIGMGEVGQAFVSELAQLTDADVAASDDTTGVNGDWELEVASGSIEASIGVSAAAQTAYQYDLGTFDFDSEAQTSFHSSISVTNSGVTLTASAGSSVITIDSNEYYQELANFSGNILITGDMVTGANQIVLSFDKPVTISQLLVTAITPDGENKVTSNLTFTPDTGSAYTTAVDGNSATTLAGFSGISTLTITSSASDVDFVVDNIIFTESPFISSATYDASTGALVVTGTKFTALAGADNDIDASDLTIFGEGGDAYTLTDTADVEITSATQFTLTLSATDKAAIDQIFNSNGTSSTGGTAYNLAGAAGFVANDSGTSDTTGNGITVSNVATPTITSASYDHSTNVLTVTGSGFVKSAGAANDVDVSALTITGNSGNTYTLTDSTDVEIIDSTRFAVTLSSGDALSVEGLLNSDGTSSDDSTTYNLAAADNWMAGAAASVNIADASNGISVSNVTAPTVTSATYNASTGTLDISGTNFVKSPGATNDLDPTRITITGDSSGSYTLTSSAVEISGETSASLVLNDTDRLYVNGLFNANGSSSGDGTTYNIAFADNWLNGAAPSTDISDNSNMVSVSGVSAPTITSATFDASTNVLVITGTNFVAKSGANNDIDASLFTFLGEGGNTYTLTDTSDVDVTSSTTATLTLSATDQINVKGLLNANGTASDDVTTYNIAAADNWLFGANANTNITDTSNGITVSGVANPTITSATYDASTNVLTVTGSNLVKASGANNDVTVSTLTLTGEGGATYTLSSSSNVEITNSNTFSITLTGADVPAVEALLNTNGTSSADSTVYNLSAADNWMPAAAASANIADTSGNAITVSNVAAPTITSANYDASTNTLVLTGANFVSSTGANNDIDVGRLTIYGEGGYSYGLPGTNDVEITSATSATITLSDSAARYIEGLLNKDGTTSDDGTTYNIAASDNWMRGAPDAVDISDASTPINVSNLSVPTATSATYDASTGVVVVTGTDLVSNLDGSRDVDLTKITFTGDGGNTYTVTSTDGVNLTSNTSFSFTLSESDRLTINGLLNANGTQSGDSTNYNISFADNWLTGAANSTDISDLSSNPVTVSGVSAPTVTAATYDATTGQLTLTGADFVAAMGPNNDIVAGQLTFTGEGGATFTLTDTPNAEVTSTTTAVLTLSAADQASISALLNANGTTSSDNTTYNLSIADNWMLAANAAADISDLSNPVTVSNVVASTESGSGNDIALNSSQNGQQTAFQPNSTVTPVAVTYTPISIANSQTSDIAGINSVTTASIMFTGTKTVSAENFGDPAAGVDEISIIRNVVTHNDGVLNSFYGSTQVASEGAGRVADTSANLSRLANGLGGGLGGGAAGGEFATLVDGFLTAEAEDNNGNDVLPLEMYALNNAGFSAELARAAGMKETNPLAALINDA